VKKNDLKSYKAIIQLCKRQGIIIEINFAAGLEYFALAQLCGFGSVFCVFFFNFQLGCLKNTPYNLQSHIPIQIVYP